MSFYDIFLNNKIKRRRRDKLTTAKTIPEYQKKACLGASATVEAAIVVPIYIYAVMAVAYLLVIIGIRLRVSEVLYDESRQLAKYAYVSTLSDGEKKQEADEDKWYGQVMETGINIGIAQAMAVDKLSGMDFLVNDFNVLQSEILNDNNNIDLIAVYSVKNPFDIFGIGNYQVKQRSKTAAWLGEKGNADFSKNNEDDGEMVYITKNGTVYHRDRNCTYLEIVVRKVNSSDIEDIRNLSGGKYYECERCHSKLENGELYITDYGDRYHNDPNCSAINRDVLTVLLKSVLDRLPCSKCGGVHD